MCKNLRVYLLQVENNVVNEGKADGLNDVHVIPGVEIIEKQEENLEISIHVNSNSPSPNTKMLMGVIGAQSIVILVDSGSTHNFLDSQVAQLK